MHSRVCKWLRIHEVIDLEEYEDSENFWII